MERDTLHIFLPLKLTSTAGREGIVVGSVEDAARELLTEWPDDGGDKFYEAVKACLDCLDEAVGPDSARMAFVQAAWEVGIQIEQ